MNRSVFKELFFFATKSPSKHLYYNQSYNLFNYLYLHLKTNKTTSMADTTSMALTFSSFSSTPHRQPRNPPPILVLTSVSNGLHNFGSKSSFRQNTHSHPVHPFISTRICNTFSVLAVFGTHTHK